VKNFKTLAGRPLKNGKSTLAMPFVRDRDVEVKR
jgi:hypothetical protein